ncbi:MAG: periplasmic heavy metal sensor [Boseongicola sp.]|nr:periplasmic heavy metal sensor [Boseongicola sp.]
MTETEPKKRRWTTVLLMISLAANLAIVGFVVGQVAFRDKPDRNPRGEREVRALIGPQFFQALEPKDRIAVLQAFAGDRDRFRQNRKVIRERIEAFLSELRSDEFSTEAVGALWAAQRADIATRQALGTERFIQQLAEMSPDERAAYADRLEKILNRVRRD